MQIEGTFKSFSFFEEYFRFGYREMRKSTLSHARRHFEPYFGPLICVDDESRFKMAASVLQCILHMLPDAYARK
jgi:hypothetical protein